MLRRASNNRYEMLEVLRQFAEERLLSVPRERDVIRDRHARHYLGILKQVEKDLKGSGLKEGLLLLRHELGNIRAAWRWSSQRAMLQDIREAATSLFLFYDIGSRYEEGAEMFREARETLGDPPVEERREAIGFLSAAQAWFVRFSSPRDCEALLKRSMDYLSAYQEQSFAALPTMMAAFVGLDVRPITMEERLNHFLGILETAGDRWGAAMALEALAYRRCKSDPEAARSLAQRSLDLRLDLGDNWGKALSLFLLGESAEQKGEYETARRRYCESRGVREELGEDREGTLGCIAAAGRVSCYLGDHRLARKLYADGFVMADEMGNAYRSGGFKLSLGMVAFLESEFDEAATRAQACLMLFESLRNKSGMAESLALLALCSLRQGNQDDALSYFERSLMTEADHLTALLGLGELHLQRTNPEQALASYRTALMRARDKGAIPAWLSAMAGLASGFLLKENAELAAELVGFIANHQGLSRDTERKLGDLVPILRKGLPESALKAAMTRGAESSYDTLLQKVERALGNERDTGKEYKSTKVKE
jgi:tetratricopeptide (TPR) repeat protein